MYNFNTNETKICDIDLYSKKPYVNKMGRLWGSSRFMSPEEFELHAIIDSRTNVFNMGAMAFAILGGGKDRSFTKWEASRDLYEIAYRAVNENRTERYASVKEFYEEWVSVSNTKRYKSILFKQIYSLYYYHDNIYEKEIKNNEANIMNFVYINQHVLNNLLYILSSIFIFYFIYDSGRNLKKYKNYLLYFVRVSLLFYVCAILSIWMKIVFMI